MHPGNRIARDLIQRLAKLGAEGDRTVDADIWHHLGDHSATSPELLSLARTLGMPEALDQFVGREWRGPRARIPAHLTRVVDEAMAFGRQLLHNREPRFGLLEAADGSWVAVVSTGSGVDALSINSKHDHAAVAMMQSIIRQHLMSPQG
jgi:hypothetical protein